MRTDKTYSELWNLTEHKDQTVREVAKMAINTLDGLHDENLELRTRIRKVKSFVKDI